MGFLKEEQDLIRAVFDLKVAIKRFGRRELEKIEADLTLEQVIVLSIIDDGEGVNISQIAELAERDATTISRMITGLENKGLVVRISDREDSRQKTVYLTKQGRESLQPIDEFRPEFVRILYDGLSDDDITHAINVLNKVAKNVEPQ